MPDGLQWTRADISDVDSRSDERDRAMIILHARRGKIRVLHLRLNESDLMATIHIQAFHMSRRLKMTSQIQRSRPI